MDNQREGNFNSKSLLKRTAQTNYRPITCLPMMWKILMAQIRKTIYYSLISDEIFSNKKKGRRKRARGTKKQLYIDQRK